MTSLLHCVYARCTTPNAGAVGGPWCRVLAAGVNVHGQCICRVQFLGGYVATVAADDLELQ